MVYEGKQTILSFISVCMQVIMLIMLREGKHAFRKVRRGDIMSQVSSFP
jgi:hypothetical protein